jgi:hypothetical protein
MEHLLYGCDNYTAKIWKPCGCSLTLAISRYSGDYIPSIDLTPLEIIYNKSDLSILLHIKEWHYAKSVDFVFGK